MSVLPLRHLASGVERSRTYLWWAGAMVMLLTVAVAAATVDGAALAQAVGRASSDPLGWAAALGAYSAAFLLRAWVWGRLLSGVPFAQALAALHVSLLGNHVLPARLGEPLRVTSVVRRSSVSLSDAAGSTIVLRAMDVLAVGALASVLGAPVVGDVVGVGPAAGVLGAAAVAAAGATWWLVRLRRRGSTVGLPGVGVVVGTLLTWVLEAAVMWQAARWVGVDLTLTQAVLVTAVTVGAQVVAVAPGGFGTYEAAATATLVALGVPAGTGLAIALTAHVVKTAYSLLAGAVALFVPAPGLLGRVRLPRVAPALPPPPPVTATHRPVVLFLPAHDEEAAVGAVVRRAPREVRGHPVQVLVIDDGSRDRTAEIAAAAGAEVVRFARNRGLGAAVRRGFHEATQRDAAAVAFCDADGEYAPEELGELVGPILDGEADYVVGSRFAGDIQRMLPHRRLGNLILTIALRLVTRRPISDGQSGYRALSARAAAQARIEHDFNYAQVLTVDLLARGFVYREAPITYRFRETGSSFIRLGRYLRAVVPAVHRVVNAAPLVADSDAPGG